VSKFGAAKRIWLPKVCTHSYVVLKDTRTPMLVTVISALSDLEKSKHDISGYVGSGSAFACGALQLGYCVLALSLKDGLKLLTSVLGCLLCFLLLYLFILISE